MLKVILTNIVSPLIAWGLLVVLKPPPEMQSKMGVVFVIMLVAANIYLFRELQGQRLAIALCLVLNIAAFALLGDLGFITALPHLWTLIF